ncbi:RNA helicase [Plasmodiophora brassicae]|nr:hypothetical protein PBRA_007252 [Plasmodiophora brassicae]
MFSVARFGLDAAITSSTCPVAILRRAVSDAPKKTPAKRRRSANVNCDLTSANDALHPDRKKLVQSGTADGSPDRDDLSCEGGKVASAANACMSQEAVVKKSKKTRGRQKDKELHLPDETTPVDKQETSPPAAKDTLDIAETMNPRPSDVDMSCNSNEVAEDAPGREGGRQDEEDDDEDAPLDFSHRVAVLPKQGADPVPMTDVNIDERIKSTLASGFGIRSLFALQAFLIPRLEQNRVLGIDCCITSPTGSGKSLCFAIPIVNRLMHRIVPRLRALVLVPTRDLAVQLRGVFDKLTSGLGLTIGMAIGQRSFDLEQDELRCAVDILIATPGRLADHLEYTDGFTLNDLEYLVVDEADRLLGQHFHDWQALVRDTRSSSTSDMQTLLFSATMSLNPLALDRLRLRDPVFYARSTRNEFACSPTLTEQMIVCESPSAKVAALIATLEQRQAERCIVFTSSVESAHNLKRVLELYGVAHVNEYHGSLPQRQRTLAIDKFRSKPGAVLVCSDAMARGIDIDDVALVVNYDCPSFLKTYLHRVGRTARANKRGTAITLTLPNEVKGFNRMLAKATKSAVHKVDVDADELDAIVAQLDPVLDVSQVLFRAEQGNAVDRYRRLRTEPGDTLDAIRTWIDGRLARKSI